MYGVRLIHPLLYRNIKDRGDFITERSWMLILVPIETIEQRYTGMMNSVLFPLFDRVVYPDFEPGKIEKGQFLDINKSSIFKAKQLEMIAQMFYKGEVKD